MLRSAAPAMTIALFLSLGAALIAEDAAPPAEPVLQPAVHRDDAVEPVDDVDAEPDQTAGTLVLELAGTFPLRPAPAFFAAGEVSLHAACLQLRQALAAPEKHLVLDLAGGFYPSLAGAEEMAAILRDRGEGRTVACLLDGIDDAALAVAAACDEVVAPEAGLLLVDGIELSVDYYADALAKLGVRFAAVTSGPHKTAPEPFTRNRPSDAGAAELAELATALDDALLACSARGPLDVARIRAARALAPQPGASAQALGLIDRAVEPGAWLDGLAQPARWFDAEGEQPDASTFAGMMELWGRLLQGEKRTRHPRVVAVVELEGEIVDDSASEPGSTIAGFDTAAMIDDLADDERVVAVVVRVNSGGGSATASDRIHHAIRRLDAVKPVIALLDEVAASGGYYLACAARRVIAHRGTLTGSIGVFALAPDLTGTRDLMGIHRHVVTTGPRADLLSTGAMTPDKEAALRQIVDDTDVRFRALVGARRTLADDRVRELAGGRVFTGQQALDNGLIDELGTLTDAVVAARAAAGVEDKLPLETHPVDSGLAGRFALFGARSAAHVAERLCYPAAWRTALRAIDARRPVIMAWSGVGAAR